MAQLHKAGGDEKGTPQFGQVEDKGVRPSPTAREGAWPSPKLAGQREGSMAQLQSGCARGEGVVAQLQPTTQGLGVWQQGGISCHYSPASKFPGP